MESKGEDLNIFTDQLYMLYIIYSYTYIICSQNHNYISYSHMYYLYCSAVLYLHSQTQLSYTFRKFKVPHGRGTSV